MRSVASHLPRRLVHAQASSSSSSSSSKASIDPKLDGLSKKERAARRFEFGQPFKLPPPIKRSPTEILETLRDATILSDDPTSRRAGTYDDPLLTPGTQDMERQNAFAMEFGKRTARLIAEEYPTLFMYGMDEPKMEYFQIRPRIQPEADTRDTEVELKGVIREARVENAIKIWENAEAAGNPIGDETRQALLELLCFYNSENDQTFTESPHIFERYYRTFLLENEAKKERWKVNGEADLVFESMTEKTGKAYSALIAGMAGRGKAKQAMDHYRKARKEKLELTTEAINALVAVGGGQLSDGGEPSDPDELWTKALKLAGELDRPTLQTFNSLLSLLTRMRSWDESQLHAAEVLQEMAHVGLKPSGHTFLLLWTIYTDDPRLFTLIDSCLDRLLAEGEGMQLLDEEDRLFFPRAMAMCHDSFTDPRLTLKLHQLFLKGKNKRLITDGLSDQSYHHHLLSSILPIDPNNQHQLPIDDFFEHYFKIVPKYLIPNPDVMNCLVKDIILPRRAFDFLPRIWNHILTLGHVYKRMTIVPYLESLYVGLRTMDPDTEEHKKFQEQTAKIVESFINVMDLQDNVNYYSPHMPWNPDLLTYCALCLIHCNQPVLSWVMMERLERYLKDESLSTRRPARGGGKQGGKFAPRARPENSHEEIFEIDRVTENLMWQLFRQYQENGLPQRAERLLPMAQQLNLRRDVEHMRTELLRQERNNSSSSRKAAADNNKTDPSTTAAHPPAAGESLSAADVQSHKSAQQQNGLPPKPNDPSSPAGNKRSGKSMYDD